MNSEEAKEHADYRRELLGHRKSMLESLARDIEYALKHPDMSFAAPNSGLWVNLIQNEERLRTMETLSPEKR